MKKVILEDIENMKYLLGYKRGVVISEQEVPPTTTSTDDKTLVSSTDTITAATTATAQPIKIGVKNPRVQVLQQLLNDKFQSGLVADGIYGPKTANAIYKNIIAINKQQIKPIETNLKPAGVKQLGTPAETGTETSVKPASISVSQPLTAAPVVAK